MKRKRLVLIALGAGVLGYGLARRSKAATERSMSMSTVGSGGRALVG